MICFSNLWMALTKLFKKDFDRSLIVLCLVTTNYLYAAEESMCLNHPIRFAHYESGLLYSKGYGGIDDDIQKELMRRSGCDFEVSVKPRVRTWIGLKSGDLDMAGSGIKTAERETFAWFFPYIFEDNVIVLGSRVPKDVHSFEQFIKNPNLKFGGVRSYRYSPYYDKYVDQLILANRNIDTADPENIYIMFAANRIDAFISNPLIYLHYVKKLKFAEPLRVEDWDPAGPSPSSLVLAKKSFTPAQSEKWRALVNELIVDGTVEKITVKHMGRVLGPKSVYRPASR